MTLALNNTNMHLERVQGRRKIKEERTENENYDENDDDDACVTSIYVGYHFLSKPS